MPPSEAETPSPADDQTQTLNQSFSILLPLIIGFATPAPPPPQDGENRTATEGLVLLDQLAGSLIMIQGLGNLDLFNKEGPLPASKASIEAMTAVKVMEEGLECAICLGEYEVGGEAKEMPCKHRYHPGCIEKWLGIHGSCPVCRYRMPLEEVEGKKGSDIEENGGRRLEGEIRISVFIGAPNSNPENSAQDVEIDEN